MQTQKTSKSKAEEKFAEIQKRTKEILKEAEKVQVERVARTEVLRALRLAKEAEDEKAADKALAEKHAAKSKKGRRPMAAQH